MENDNVKCPKCGSSYNRMFLMGKQGNADVCPMCGADMQNVDDNSVETTKVKTKWYYYKDSTETLTTTLYEDEIPLYAFEAADMEDAKRQLKEVVSNSLLVKDNTPEKVQCPYCFSSEVQIVPKKFSLLTGFATNQFDRVCLRCKRRF